MPTAPTSGSEPNLKTSNTTYDRVNSATASVEEKSELLRQASTSITLKDHLSQISIPVYALVCIFSWSSWLAVVGLWVEVPLLVQRLPESWRLPTYLAIIIQLANIGPLIYTIVNRLAPNKVKEWPVVYVIISISSVASLLVVFFWDSTSVIGGERRSLGLFLVTALLSLADCLSTVVYLPYMASYKPQYITAYYIGGGLGGLVPALVGLAQGSGSAVECVNRTVAIHDKTIGSLYLEYQLLPEIKPPVFSLEVFFYFLFFMSFSSGIAFSLLHFCPVGKRERMKRSKRSSDSSFANLSIRSRESRDHDGKEPGAAELTKTEFALLLFLVACCNALTNGVATSVQPFACLPYGNTAYSLSVRLSAVANPLVCFLALFKSVKTTRVVAFLVFFGAAACGFQVYLASKSPTPPLKDSDWGVAIVVSGSTSFYHCTICTFLKTLSGKISTTIIVCFQIVSSIFIMVVLVYSKVCISTIAMTTVGRRGLLWVGGASQLGSFSGTLIMFGVVGVLEVFKSQPPLC